MSSAQTSEPFPRIIFFFGAGASVKAGVKTTFGLVDQFMESLSSRKLQNFLQNIISLLEKNNGKVDIEKLLQTIERLENRKSDEILRFYDTKKFKLKNPDLLSQLKRELKSFINTVTSIKPENVDYVRQLLSYERPVRIFSVNYDTLIEQFCNVYKKSYTDGFDYSWNPQLFNNHTMDFHLYKLHGSIMWYKTDRGDYLKLPLPPAEENVKLIFGERANHLMLYPMQKWEFDEPLLDMMMKFKQYLEKAHFVVVVGYSFRDPHMLRIFHDAARKNHGLILILIDPDSRKTYNSKLRYYIDNEAKNIPSSLEDRVLCLPYKFEKILPALDEYISSVQTGFAYEENCYNNMYRGNEPRWLWGGPLEYYFNCEFIDRANLIVDKVDWEKEKTDPFKLLVKSFQMFVSNEEQGLDGKPWLKIFLLVSDYVSVDRLSLSLNRNPHTMRYSFRQAENSSWPFESPSQFFDEILQFIKRKKTEQSNSELIRHLSEKLVKLSNFIKSRKGEINWKTFETFTDGNTYNDKSEDWTMYLNTRETYLNNNNDPQPDNFRNSILIIETKRLRSILGDSTLRNYLKSIVAGNRNYGFVKYRDVL